MHPMNPRGRIKAMRLLTKGIKGFSNFHEEINGKIFNVQCDYMLQVPTLISIVVFYIPCSM
jgi:hypothetical protein